MTLELHATPEEVMRAVRALEDFAHSKQVPEKTIFSLALALEECGSNIVNHALNRDPEQTFHVAIDQNDDVFTIALRDRGPRFDPTAAPERGSEADSDADDLPGGWGIQLVRRNVDQIEYQREAGENILRLTKRLVSGAAPR